MSDSLPPYGLWLPRPLCPMGFSKQKYWIGLSFLSPRDLPDPGMEPGSPALQSDSFPLSHQGSPLKQQQQQHIYTVYTGFRGASVVKDPPANQEIQVPSLGQEDPLEKETATHSSILAWEIPWAEEADGLQSMGSQESDMTS